MNFSTHRSSVRKSRGFTLIELMVAVTIIAIAIIALLGRYSAAKQATQVQQETGNVQTIVSATQAAFAGQPSFQNLTTDVIKATNGFPTQMVNGSTVTNVWTGSVSMGPAQLPVVNNSKAQIDYALVPQSACIAFVNSVALTVDSMYVDTTVVKPSGGNIVTPALIQTACVAGTNTVKIIFAN